MPTANPKPNLLPIFTRLDELTRQLPRHADPQLLHIICTRKATKKPGSGCKAVRCRESGGKLRACRMKVVGRYA